MWKGYIILRMKQSFHTSLETLWCDRISLLYSFFFFLKWSQSIRKYSSLKREGPLLALFPLTELAALKHNEAITRSFALFGIISKLLFHNIFYIYKGTVLKGGADQKKNRDFHFLFPINQNQWLICTDQQILQLCSTLIFSQDSYKLHWSQQWVFTRNLMGTGSWPWNPHAMTQTCFTLG